MTQKSKYLYHLCMSLFVQRLICQSHSLPSLLCIVKNSHLCENFHTLPIQNDIKDRVHNCCTENGLLRRCFRFFWRSVSTTQQKKTIRIINNPISWREKQSQMTDQLHSVIWTALNRNCRINLNLELQKYLAEDLPANEDVTGGLPYLGHLRLH